ncbi:hypothetical protein PSTT_01149, partial [Puccinia striiformis]
RLERTRGRLGCQSDPADEPASTDVLDIWLFKSGTPPRLTRVCLAHRTNGYRRGGRRGFMASSLRGQMCLTSGHSSRAHHLVQPESALPIEPTRAVGSGHRKNATNSQEIAHAGGCGTTNCRGHQMRYSHRLFNKFHGDGSFDMTYCSWKEIKAEREALNKKLKAETPTRPRQGNVGPSNQHRCH